MSSHQTCLPLVAATFLEESISALVIVPLMKKKPVEFEIVTQKQAPIWDHLSSFNPISEPDQGPSCPSGWRFGGASPGLRFPRRPLPKWFSRVYAMATAIEFDMPPRMLRVEVACG